MLDRSVDAAIGIGRIVARIVTEHQADTGRIEVTPLGAQILGGIVAKTDGFEMTEIGVCTHIRVSEHFVNVPYRDHATLGRIVGHAVIERRVVTQSPEIGRLRRYLGIVCQAVLVACEERVARKGYAVEPDDRYTRRNRHVGRLQGPVVSAAGAIEQLSYDTEFKARLGRVGGASDYREVAPAVVRNLAGGVQHMIPNTLHETALARCFGIRL